MGKKLEKKNNNIGTITVARVAGVGFIRLRARQEGGTLFMC